MPHTTREYRSQAPWFHSMVRETRRSAVMPNHNHTIERPTIKNRTQPPPTKEVEVSEIEKLNPKTRGYDWKFKTKNGAVNYLSSGMKGCCGIGVISSVSFGNMKDHKEFYEELLEFIINDTGETLNRRNIVLTDAVGGEHRQEEQGRPCVYSMCKHLGLSESKPMYNPRTGHTIIMFTLEKKVIGIYNQYPPEGEE